MSKSAPAVPGDVATNEATMFLEGCKILGTLAFSGSYGSFRLQILGDAPTHTDFTHPVILDAVDKSMDLLQAALGEAAIASDEKAQQHRRQQRDELIGLFDEPILVEEIPNGYCGRWCCRHLPWFIVTTRIGRITLGWCKRVISIDWTGSLVTKTADELFPEENVTKEGKLIHAWSVEDAKRYIATVIASVE